MRRFFLGAAVAVFIGLIGCGGSDEPEPPLTLDAAPDPVDVPGAPVAPSEGPYIEDWYVDSNSSSGSMMLNFERDDEAIWIHFDTSVRDQDLQTGVDRHRRDFERDEMGTHRGTGTTETAGYGVAAWSWGTMAGEESEDGVEGNPGDELALFAKHPKRPVLLVFRYTFPATDDIDEKLEELVAVADSLVFYVSGAQ
jgi:hypothetical protein